MWLMDHQMNIAVSKEFGHAYARIPLVKSANIVNDNALRLDWSNVLPAHKCSYILGNPPFIGKQHQSPQQKADLKDIFASKSSPRELDLVAAWYVKAARFMDVNTEAAFVSTSSLSQRQQPGLLWSELLTHDIGINFAHRTFRWASEARGQASVHCVVIGFGKTDKERKQIFEYEHPDSEPHSTQVTQINPYLVDGPTVLLVGRSAPISTIPPIRLAQWPMTVVICSLLMSRQTS